MSVPTRGAPRNPKNQLPAAWFARVDGCPMCVYNVEAPRSVEARGTGFRAYYDCRDCGHRWFTGWADE